MDDSAILLCLYAGSIVVVAAGFLPVLVMRNKAAKVVFGIVAGVLGSNALFTLFMPHDPSLGGVVQMMVYAASALGCAVLALIGMVAGAVRLARGGFRKP